MFLHSENSIKDANNLVFLLIFIRYCYCNLGGAHTSEVSGSAMSSLQVGEICGTLYKHENIRFVEGKRLNFMKQTQLIHLQMEVKFATRTDKCNEFLL
jgi:hypothetical protein